MADLVDDEVSFKEILDRVNGRRLHLVHPEVALSPHPDAVSAISSGQPVRIGPEPVTVDENLRLG